MRHACLLLFALVACAAAGAQPLRFGLADDPFEAPLGRGFAPVDASEVVLFGGPSFIDDRWRAVGGLEARLEVRRVGVGLVLPGRSGVSGVYSEDYDEAYDVLRRLSYVRFNPTLTSPVYLRIGPLENLRLGSGLLLDGYATTTAWEERTIGVEAAARLGPVTFAGFIEDVLLNGLVGGHLVYAPFRGSSRRFRRVRVTMEGTYDLALDELRREAPPDSLPLPLALGATLQAPLWGDVFAVGPYAAGAYQWDRGTSAELGVEAAAERFADLLDLRVRLGIFGFENGVRITPHDAFYPLTRGAGQIVQVDPFYNEPDAPRRPASLAPDSVEAGWGVLLDSRTRIGDGFVVGQTIRVATGDQPVGAQRFRAAYATSQGLRFVFAFERGGVRRLGDLFQGFDADLTTLHFDVDYPITPRIVARMRARYGFTQLPARLPSDEISYLTERRFEPTVGVRFRF